MFIFIIKTRKNMKIIEAKVEEKYGNNVGLLCELRASV
jgi:hypothetical protein